MALVARFILGLFLLVVFSGVADAAALAARASGVPRCVAAILTFSGTNMLITKTTASASRARRMI